MRPDETQRGSTDIVGASLVPCASSVPGRHRHQWHLLIDDHRHLAIIDNGRHHRHHRHLRHHRRHLRGHFCSGKQNKSEEAGRFLRFFGLLKKRFLRSAVFEPLASASLSKTGRDVHDSLLLPPRPLQRNRTLEHFANPCQCNPSASPLLLRTNPWGRPRDF